MRPKVIGRLSSVSDRCQFLSLMNSESKRLLLFAGRAVIGLSLVCSAAFAQFTLDGPLLGFLFEGSGDGVRAVLGIPGVARIGAPLQLDEIFAKPVVSNSGGYVLGAKHDGTLVLVDLVRGQSREIFRPETEGAVVEIALSPSGNSALLYVRPEQKIAILSGLPDAPKIVWQAVLDDSFQGPVVAAISDDGRVALLALRESNQLFAATAGEGVRHLEDREDRNVVAIQFAPRSHTAVFLDTLNRQVVFLRDAAANDTAFVLAGPDSGIVEPAAVSFSGDRSRLFVENAGSSRILMIDLESGHVSEIPCPCVPSRLERLRGDSVFLLTDSVEGVPLWVLDADAAEPRVVFIPAVVKR